MALRENIVYGMYSGTALLMDAHQPEKPNGYGVVYISGSGWYSSPGYGTVPLKAPAMVSSWVDPLTAAGYTVFAINHRAAPVFRYPAPVEDARRAVRFVRHHAAEFGIRADRIGASGGSSGGHLSCLLGVQEAAGDPGDADPVNRESAQVQCVVARAAPVDMFEHSKGPVGGVTAINFIGMLSHTAGQPVPKTSDEWKAYEESSPINYVTSSAAPTLLIHGTADAVVAFEQSELMLQALTKAGVPAKLLPVPEGGHGPAFEGAVNPPDYIGEMVQWFDRHLVT